MVRAAPARLDDLDAALSAVPVDANLVSVARQEVGS